MSVLVRGFIGVLVLVLVRVMDWVLVLAVDFAFGIVWVLVCFLLVLVCFVL